MKFQLQRGARAVDLIDDEGRVAFSINLRPDVQPTIAIRGADTIFVKRQPFGGRIAIIPEASNALELRLRPHHES